MRNGDIYSSLDGCSASRAGLSQSAALFQLRIKSQLITSMQTFRISKLQHTMHTYRHCERRQRLYWVWRSLTLNAAAAVFDGEMRSVVIRLMLHLWPSVSLSLHNILYSSIKQNNTCTEQNSNSVSHYSSVLWIMVTALTSNNVHYCWNWQTAGLCPSYIHV